ncbi:MAG TPA: metal ABC transporter permease, partial [Ideonella sp.]|nr:metal ABC transporter permease [Ideonella sp.]
AATVIAMLSGLAGLLLSFHAAWPSGPAIVLVAGAIYLLSLLAGPREGLLWRLRRGGRHQRA